MLNFEDHEYFGICCENDSVKYWAIKQINEGGYAVFWGARDGTMRHKTFELFDTSLDNIITNGTESLAWQLAESINHTWITSEMKQRIRNKQSKYVKCDSIDESDQMLRYIEQVILFERLSN